MYWMRYDADVSAIDDFALMRYVIQKNFDLK